MTLLRDLPLDFTFARNSYPSQVQVQKAVQDNAGDATTELNLKGNEVTVMALNEVAVARKRGFFWHLPNRDRLKNDRNTANHGKGGKRKGVPVEEGEAALGSGHRDVPADRLADETRPDFPTMLYMDHSWTDKGCERFLETPHRARYMLCDGLLNGPQSDSSVHCIQYAGHPLYQVFATDNPSIVVLEMATAFFAMSTQDLSTIRGRMKHNSTQFSQMSKLWGVDQQAVEDFRCEDVQKLYSNLVEVCALGRSIPITGRQFSQLIPRPVTRPEPAQLLGTAPGAGEGDNNRSGPRSSRGASRQRGKGRQTVGEEVGVLEGQDLV